MKRRIFKLIIVVATLLFLLVVVLCQFGLSLEWFGLASVVYIGTIIVCEFSLRCPNCGRWPRRGSLWAKYCPRCGQNLDEETMF